MAKIAMIGAGSLVFAKTLMNDFLGTPALAGSEYSLMALTHKRLDTMHGFVERINRRNRHVSRDAITGLRARQGGSRPCRPLP
jgi:alpha-galactosidase